MVAEKDIVPQVKAQLRNPGNRSWWHHLQYQGKRFGVLIALAIVFAVFSLLEPHFHSLRNVLTIVRQAAILGFLSLGETVVVISGEFDMSFAANATFAGVICVVLLMSGVPLPIALLVGWVGSVAVALANALTILYIGIPSFIATLGMMAGLTGLSRCFTGGATCYSAYFPRGFELLGRGFVFSSIPTPALTFTVVAMAFLILLGNTKRGRYLYVVGASASAANRAGINVRRTKLAALIVSGVLSGFAGLTTASMLGSANPVMCDGYLMPAIIGCFLGAVFLRDGVPNVAGTIVACLLLSVLTNGFVMVGLPSFLKEIVQGLILLIAVGSIALLRKGSIPGIRIA